MDHPIGLIIYIGGVIVITLIHITNGKDIKVGFKGENKLWGYPEWIMYVFSWIWPNAIMADQYLGLHMGEYAWYFMYILLLFGLTGTLGLRWVLAFRQGKSLEETSSTTTTTITEQKQQQT